MQQVAYWELESDGMKVDLTVGVSPPWWAFWRPRGRFRLTLDRKEVILFYQTLHKVATKVMILEP